MSAKATHGGEPLGEEPLDRGPLPKSLDNERAVLGALICGGSPSMDGALRQGLTDRSFYSASHQTIFRVLRLLGPEDVTESAVAAGLRGSLTLKAASVETARITGAACPPARLAAEIRSLLKVQREREAHLAGRTFLDELGAGDEPTEAIARVISTLSDLARSVPGALDLTAAAAAFEAIDPAAVAIPESLLGDGVFCLGDLGVCVGKASAGKSRCMLEWARAVSRGEPWLGFKTSSRPMRVGYVATEFPTYRLWERCVPLFGAGVPPKDPRALAAAYRALKLRGEGGALVPIPRDLLADGLDLLTDSGASALEQFIREERLNLVVLDTLSRLMGGRDETNEFFGMLTVKLDRVRVRTGAALMLVHHPRKPGTQQDSSRADPLDSVRGGTKLTGAVNTVLVVSRLSGNLRRLECPKANYAPEPEPVFFSIPEDGGPSVLERAPTAKGEENRELVRAWVEQAGGWVSCHDAPVTLRMVSKTVKRHLADLAKRGLLDHQKGKKGADLYRCARDTGTHLDKSSGVQEQANGLLEDGAGRK